MPNRGILSPEFRDPRTVSRDDRGAAINDTDGLSESTLSIHDIESREASMASNRQSRVSRASSTGRSSIMTNADGSDNTKGLVISFVLMVFVGLGNKIFQKLQTIPMYNYANFLNLLTTFFYIPISFAYIIPMIKWGNQITPEQRKVPMRDFAVMGGLDSLAGIMQIFAATYLDGTLLILLSQAAIPISMLISRFSLNATYRKVQYIGALVVGGGIALVLVPRLTGDDGSADDDDSTPAPSPGFQSDCSETGGGTESSGAVLLWALVMIFSCVPMTLSSVYKEKALGQTELDPVYLNGWIAVWQFLCSIPIAVVAGVVSSPKVTPSMLPTNLIDGLKCYAGHNSLVDDGSRSLDDDFHCFAEDDCADAPVFVTTYLFFNVGYNILIILILKYGSANILWLAMTIMVPLGSMAFALPFIPQHSPPKITDVMGLVVILGGLVLYRFGQSLMAKFGMVEEDDRESEDGRAPLLADDGVARASEGSVGLRRRSQSSELAAGHTA